MNLLFALLAGCQDPDLDAALKKERERLASRSPLAEGAKKSYVAPDPVKTKPVSGYKLLVVRLSFSDAACRGDGVEKLVFTDVAGYWTRVSGNSFTLSGRVAEVAVTLGTSRDAFGKVGLRSTEEGEALATALKVIDRSGYDGVAFVAAGKIGSKETSLWPHRWSVDGTDFVLVPEDAGERAVGIVAHEIGHLFGLEDQYDDPKCDVGAWCLYGKGYAEKKPAPLCAGCLERLGWGRLGTVDPRTERRVRVAAGEVARITLNTDGREYLLLEVREKAGVLVWHCGGGKSIELLGTWPTSQSDRITPWSDPPFKARAVGSRDVWITDLRFEGGIGYFTVGPSAPLTPLEELRKSRVGKRLGD